MDNLLRLDSVVLTKSELDKSTGFLKCPAQVTRPGIFTYMQGGKVRRELRRPEEVFRADSMATLQNKPFVHGHPYSLGGEVNASNARRIMRGMTGGVAYKDGNNLCVDVFITDEESIKAAKAGKIALSAGYTVDTIEQPGEWEGQRYDAEQVNIRYNHVAQVAVGRAGKDAKLRLDENLNEISTQESEAMVKIKLDDGREIEVTEEVASAFRKAGEFQAAAIQRADDAEAELTITRNELATVTGERDGMKTRLDGLTSEERKTAEKTAFLATVKARTALVATAQTILPAKDHARLDSMEDVEIMQAVIRADAGDAELKLDADEKYLKGRFEQVIVSRGKGAKRSDSGTDLGRQINAARADEKDEEEDGEDEAEKKKKKLTERYKSAPGAKR